MNLFTNCLLFYTSQLHTHVQCYWYSSHDQKSVIIITNSCSLKQWDSLKQLSSHIMFLREPQLELSLRSCLSLWVCCEASSACEAASICDTSWLGASSYTDTHLRCQHQQAHYSFWPHFTWQSSQGFLTPNIMVLQACLWCLQLFPCLPSMPCQWLSIIQ